VGYHLPQKLKMPVCIGTTAEAGNNNPLLSRQQTGDRQQHKPSLYVIIELVSIDILEPEPARNLGQ
jgi:hypothetical protein